MVKKDTVSMKVISKLHQVPLPFDAIIHQLTPLIENVLLNVVNLNHFTSNNCYLLDYTSSTSL